MKNTSKQADVNEVRSAIVSIRNALDALERAIGKDW